MLEDLPNELWSNVLEFCEHEDQLQARLVCKVFAEACEPFIYEQISLCWYDFSFSKFQLIAQSSFARHVKRITIYTDSIVPTFGASDFLTCMAKIYNPSSFYIPTTGFCLTYIQWAFGYYTYEQLRVQLPGIIAMVEDGALRQAFAKLLNLREVNVGHFSEGPSYPPSTRQIPWTRVSLDLVREFTCYVTSWRRDDSLMDDWSVAQVFDALSHRAIHQAKPLRTLTIETRSSGGYFGRAEPTEFENLFSATMEVRPRSLKIKDARGPALVRVLQHLTRLLIRPTRKINAISSDEDIRYLLQHSTNLHHLTVAASNCEPHHVQDLRQHFQLSALLGSVPTPWPALQSIKLSTNMFKEDLLNFLRQHQGTLRHLTIKRASITDVSDLLTTLPTAIRLSSIRLYRLSNWTEAGPDADGDFGSIYLSDRNMSSEAEQYLLAKLDHPPDWSTQGFVLGKKEQLT